MALNIKDFEIRKTFNNVVLSTVTGSPDTDGIPLAFIQNRRTSNLTLRDQGRLQDGFGTAIPLVLGRNLIEVECEPASAYSVIRRSDVIGLYATQFISSMLWS